MTAPNSKEDLKQMLREVVKEQLQEMSSSSHTVPTQASSKAKSKASPHKNKTQFDHTRAMTMDERDPRTRKETWPCFGTHANMSTSNNRFAQWTECSKCALRVQYVPAVGAPGQSTRTDLTMNVTEAIQKLRAEGWEAEEMTGSAMKAAIAMVAKEKIIKNKGKKNSGYPNKEKEKESRKLDQVKTPAEMMSVPSSEDEGKFQLVKASEEAKE